ncbi:RNA methyltransferase, partial [Rhizobium jaguaris]
LELRSGAWRVEDDGVVGFQLLRHQWPAEKVAAFSGHRFQPLRIACRMVEGEDKPLAALDHAARNTQGLKPVTTERRDLFRRPLMAQELKAYDAVVFDPPRAGAEFQSKELARSAVKKIVAVSCNPTTLARDLALLVESGYRITRVTPIDQFLWTSHVEVVAALEK